MTASLVKHLAKINTKTVNIQIQTYIHTHTHTYTYCHTCNTLLNTLTQLSETETVGKLINEQDIHILWNSMCV